MPNYEYKCTKCANIQTISRSITTKEVPPMCNECATQMQRKFSSPLVTFRGSDFYSTTGREDT